MKNIDKIKLFQDKLLSWYEINKRNFAWRKPNLNNYQIIISEILLQRTKAETISNFYDPFLLKYPDWHSLANVELAELELSLMPIGLYRQRSKRLLNLAAYMVENGEELPLNRELLENLPFMGQYIANAVGLLIHGEQRPLLDVNMARVLERYFEPRKLADIRHDPFLQNLARQVVNHEKSKLISWATLDFAALICKARNPLCNKCVLNTTCSYYVTNK